MVSQGHGDVVEESGAAGADRDEQAGGTGGGRRPQVGIGEFEVVLEQVRMPREHVPGGGEDGAPAEDVTIETATVAG